MTKEKKFDFGTNWYELWMQQNKEFFDTANKNLKDLFPQGGFVNPNDHLNQVNQWLDLLKKQWQLTQLADAQKEFENYWKMTIKMWNEASDKLLEQWMKRSKENPVKNIQELYELWLECCQEVYKKATVSKDFQQLYGEYVNAMLKFWKSAMPK